MLIVENQIEILPQVFFNIHSILDRCGTVDFCNNHRYEPENTNVLINHLMKIKNDFIFIDIGAYIGYFSLVCLSIFKNSFVHAFEPNEQNLILLRKNLQPYDNCCIHPFCLSNKEEKTIFYEDNDKPECCTLNKSFMCNELAFTHREIFSKRLSSFNIDFKKVVALKIDAEGSDFIILEDIFDLFEVGTMFIIEEIANKPESFNSLKLEGLQPGIYIKK